MATHKKRDLGSSSCSTITSDSNDDCPKKRKCQITVTTFNKWQGQYNSLHKSLLWLRCDKDRTDRRLVSALWCCICRKYEKHITGLKNFSKAWIDGTDNQRTSSVVDHASSNQHTAAMVRYNQDQAKAFGEPASSYSPIVRLLSTMDLCTKARMILKFDVCYFLVKEGMAFKKFPRLLELESRHEVDLGSAYNTDVSAQLFTHFIAKSQRDAFLKTFSQKSFFSIMMDGTTDSGNLEDELVVVLYCHKDDASGVIRSCTRYLSIENPKRADTDGCLGMSLEKVGVENLRDKQQMLSTKPILVGGGTDGASVNVGQHKSLKQEMQKHMPWMF